MRNVPDNMKIKPIQIQNMALYFFCFSLHFEFWDPLNTNIDFFLSKLSIIVYLSSILISYEKFIIINKAKDVLYPIIFLFCAQTIVSFAYRNDLFSVFFDFPFFLNILILFLIINHSLLDNKSVEKGLLAFAIGGIIVSLLYMLGISINISDDPTLEGRVALFGDNQNAIGIRITVSMFILISYMFRSNIRKWGLIRFLLFLLLPILLSLLSATGSRVAIISFFFGIVAFVVLKRTNTLSNKVIKALVGAIIIYLIWLYLSSNEILYSRLADTVISGDTSGRDYIWLMLLEFILKNPYFGQGTTGYAYNSYLIFGGVASPHNAIIETFCYTGLFGTILFIVFMYRISKRAYKAAHNADLLPLLLLIPILGLILSGQIYYPKFVWVIFAYITTRSLIHSRIPLRHGIE